MKNDKQMQTHGEARTRFLDALERKVEELGFKGPIKGEPKLPKAGESLSLEQIARIKIMMGMVGRAEHVFEAGADPSYTHHGQSMWDLNNAYARVHGKKESQQMNDLLQEYGAEKPRRKPRSSKK